MTNPTSTQKEPTEKNQANRSDAIRELRTEGSKIAGEASEMANDLFGRASHWLQSDSGRIQGLAVAAIAGGVLGYFLGKNSTSTTEFPTH